MSYYIELGPNGLPKLAARTAENALEIDPSFDPDNLSERWAIVNMTAPPDIDYNTVLVRAVYNMNEDGTVDQLWETRPITEAQAAARNSRALTELEQNKININRTKWVITGDSAENYALVPPVPYPDDGNEYVWNDDSGSWDLHSGS